MKYLELNFTIQPYSEMVADVLAAELANIGCETFVPTSSGLQAYIQAENLPINESGKHDTTTIDAVVDSFPLPNVTLCYQITEAPDEDWNAVWESEGFEPIHIEDKLYIYDDRVLTNEHHVPAEVKQSVIIRPRQAFGTGSHQTTRMVLKALLSLNLNQKTVIDAGCGTGILGIVAAKYGANNIFAYDIDEWSVKNAEENFNINEIDKSVRVILEGDASVLKNAPQADVLVANIHRNIILNDMSAFVQHIKPQGYFIISGFLAEDVDALTIKAISLGLELMEIFSDEEWQCIMFKNTKQ